MPSYVNDTYVQRKLAHVDEQIEALRAKNFAVPLAGASDAVKSISFQEERKSVLLWATTASDDDVAEALRFLEPRSMPAVVALRSDGDLRGVPFEAVQARAYWELITCVVTPPETGQGVQP